MENQAIFNNQEIFEVGNSELDLIKEEARQATNGRFRICLHQCPSEAIQEMLIAMTSDTRLWPHRRPGTRRSYSIIEGEVGLYLFDETGKEHHCINLSQQQTRFVRLSGNHYILPVVRSDIALLHEIAEGPFSNDDDYAVWFNQALQEKYQ